MTDVKSPNAANDDDSSLVRRFLDGDGRAFDRLVERYQQYVFNVIRHTVGETGDAADIAQDIFVKVHRSLASYQSESAFSTWLYRITVNTCLDELRRRKRAARVRLDDLTDDEEMRLADNFGANTGRTVERNERREIVGKAIGELPETLRIAVTMRDINGLSYEEIAAVLGCSVGTVKSRLFNGRMKLREWLEQYL